MDIEELGYEDEEQNEEEEQEKLRENEYKDMIHGK